MYDIIMQQSPDEITLKISITKDEFKQQNILYAFLPKRRVHNIHIDKTKTPSYVSLDNKYYARVSWPRKTDVFQVVGLYLKTGLNRIIKLSEVYKKNDSWERDKSISPYPSRMIGISLTNQCNLHCTMCWQNDRSVRSYISYDKICDILNDISHLGKPPIYLWGGEPLLHPDIIKIIRAVKSYGLFCIINTNGTMLKKLSGEIINFPPDMIIVSIDGTEELHDKIRGKAGIYKDIIEGMKLINAQKKHKPIFAINCVITEANYEVLEEVEKLRETVGASFLEYQLLMFYSKKEKNSYKNFYGEKFDIIPKSIDGYIETCGNIDFNKLWNIIDRIQNTPHSRTRLFPYKINSMEKLMNYIDDPQKICNQHCSNIENTLWVESDGEVYPCSNFTDFSIGNIYRDNVTELWNNEKFLYFRDTLNKGLLSICGRCCDMYKTDKLQANG